MFSGKKILILGGSGGIGREIVSCFRDYHGEVSAPSHAQLDLADAESINNYFRSVDASCNAMVYAAGINVPKPFEELTEENLTAALKINALGFFSVCSHVVPAMKRLGGGRIVVLSSIYGIISRRSRLPYSLSKHALYGMVQTLAMEVAKDGILVNAISPGFIGTEMTYRNNPPEKVAELTRGIPVGRLGTGREIGEVAAFLCSPRNSYITGQNIVADGGYIIGGWQSE